MKRRKNMNDQNRVLLRQNARDLTEDEIDRVPAGLNTKTKCTFAPELSGREGEVSVSSRDGDVGEC
jgi:hypothetical protein